MGSDIKIDSKVTVSETAEMTSEDTAKVQEEKPFLPQERSPCHWIMSGDPEVQVEARNSLTGRVYVGTLKGFNALLRG
jgi:hypothetical protein